MHRFAKLWMIGLVGMGLGACAAEVEDPGEAPEITVEEGEMPDIDVDAADIEVGTDTQTVVVPDVDVEPANP